MRFRIKRNRRRRMLKKRERGIPYIYRNRVYLAKKPRQLGGGVVSKTLGRILETVGDIIGI